MDVVVTYLKDGLMDFRVDTIEMAEAVHSIGEKEIPALQFRVGPALPDATQGTLEGRRREIARRSKELFETLTQLLVPLEGILKVFPDEAGFSTYVIVERRFRRRLRKVIRRQDEAIREAFKAL